MQRPCDECGQTYAARRPTSKFCSTNCRTRAARRRKAGIPAPVRVITDDAPTATGRLAAATLEELGPIAETSDGLLLLALAERIDAAADTGSSIAALSREYAARKADLTETAPKAANPMDELRALRERRRTG
jgi:hypothetical protein